MNALTPTSENPDWAWRRAVIEDYDAVVAVQYAAYARNRVLLGREPLPLQVDYRKALLERDVWLILDDHSATEMVVGVLVLEPRAADMLIESVATHPQYQGRGIGKFMLALAEEKARDRGLSTISLYTGTVLTHNIDWYTRHGYVVDRVDDSGDRSITYMNKTLP